MKVQIALGELGNFCEPATDDDFGYRVRAQVFQHAAGKITHVDHGVIRQAKQRLGLLLGCFAGAAGDHLFAGGACDIDATMDRFDPRRAGIGHDHAGCPEN